MMRLLLAAVVAITASASQICERHATGVDCTLRVVSTRVQLPLGIAFNTRTYNGHYPARPITARPGDVVTIHLVNDLGPNMDGQGCDSPLAAYRAANSTNLHVHGSYAPPSEDNTFLCLDPLTNYTYSLTVDNRTGSSLLFYHAHFDGSSGMQLYGGMAGAFEVVDAEQERRFGLDSAFELTCTLVLSLVNLDSAVSDYVGKFLDNGGTSALPLELVNPTNYSGVLVLANGAAATVHRLPHSAWARLKLVNAMSGANNILHLALVDREGTVLDEGACELAVLAYDGVFLDAPRPQDSVLLPAGGRVEVATRCMPGIDAAALATTEPSGVATEFGGVVEPGHPVALFAFTAEGATVDLPGALPGPPEFYRDLTDATVAGRNTVLLSNEPGDNIVNGYPYDGSVSYSTVVGSVEEWQLYGGEAQGFEQQHPYHQHMTHFQVMRSSVDTGGLVTEVGDWRDTLPLYRALNFTVRFQAPFAGVMMVHCHVLKHEDLGMMTLVNLTSAGTDRR